MKQVRKWLGIILSLFMIVSILPMQAQGAMLRKNTKIDNMNPALQSLERQVQDKLQPNDPVKLIVELKNTDKVNIATVNKNKGQVIAASQSVVKSFKNTIKTKNIKGTVVNSYNYLFAGVAIDTTLAEARKIAVLPEVKMVEIAVQFASPKAAPTKAVAKPGNTITPSLAPIYKGEGQLISIIGTGADPVHQDFFVSQMVTAKYQTEGDVTNKITSLGLPGVYFNEKVSYGYNYMDMDNNVRDLEIPSRTMAAAGIAAGNGDPLTGVVGVAPEAQLLIMRVYGDFVPYTTADVFVKAIEDSVLLEADSIYLGVGLPSGSISDVGAITTAAIQKACDIGSVVNIAAGNEGQFGYSFDDPSAKNPDYGVISAPAIAPKAFAVASSSSPNSMDPLAMSDFSSWGIAPDGDLKPEITAPGDMIWSTLKDDSYDYMSGTEMAAAQITGGVALMSQMLKVKDPGGRWLPANRTLAIKNSLMNTAKPHVYPGTTTFTSPRKQGAGIMDLTAALTSDVIITNTSDEAKLALGSLNNDVFTLNTKIFNYGLTPVTYNVRTVVTTDEVVGGKMSLKPRFLKTITGTPVTIPAGSSVTLNIPVDVSTFRTELIGLMPNGYFIEGFVMLEQTAMPTLSLPFTGFRGAWNDLPILEKSIYDYPNLAVDHPFYFNEFDNNDFTHFGTLYGGTYIVIGETTDLNLVRSFDKTLLGISPNADSYHDEIMLNGVFLRNFKNIQLNVYQAGGTTPIYSSPLNPDPTLNTGAKNFDSLAASTYWPDWMWDGIVAGVPVADGNYVLEIAGALNATGAPLQTYRYNIMVDTVAPKLTTMLWNPTTGRLTMNATDPNGIGIYYSELTDAALNIIPKQVGGYYQLAPNANLADYFFVSEDHLGNYLGDLVSNLMPDVSRIQGIDRYETAALISSAMMTPSDIVVLASGLDFPDALSGIAYAAEKNAPMLLTSKNQLPAVTLAEIQRLGATKVHILGGTGAVSAAVATQLANAGLTVTRIQGLDRYETAVAIGENMIRANKTVFLASGLDYADAISAGAASALSGTPVLLSQNTTLPTATKDALTRWGTTNVTILGGPGAISQGIQTTLEGMNITVNRLGGLDRFETNLNINNAYFTDPTTVYVASGVDYPDALTGALLAAHNDTTIVLTALNQTNPSLTSYLTGNPINKVVILGGPGAVSDGVKNTIVQLLLN